MSAFDNLDGTTISTSPLTASSHPSDFTETVQQHSGSTFMDLFSRKYARLLIIGIGLMALVQLGGNNAITSFASSIFRAAGCSADSASQVMAVLQLPFAVASIILTEKAGKRLLMLAPCTSKIVRRTFLLCNSNAVSSGTAVLPASSSVKPSSKPSSIQRSDATVPKITAIPLPATCTMDISPSHSDILVSMDESMDTVRSLFNIYSFLFINYFMDLEES